jgi:hypothetical protein
MLGPYTADATGAVTFPVPKISEVFAPVFDFAFAPPSVIKLRLGDSPQRRQLLATGLQLFSFDSPTGRIAYEASRQGVFD